MTVWNQRLRWYAQQLKSVPYYGNGYCFVFCVLQFKPLEMISVLCSATFGIDCCFVLRKLTF